MRVSAHCYTARVLNPKPKPQLLSQPSTLTPRPKFLKTVGGEGLDCFRFANLKPETVKTPWKTKSELSGQGLDCFLKFEPENHRALSPNPSRRAGGGSGVSVGWGGVGAVGNLGLGRECRRPAFGGLGVRGLVFWALGFCVRGWGASSFGLLFWGFDFRLRVCKP